MFDSTLDTEHAFGHSVGHESNMCSPPPRHRHRRHGARGAGAPRARSRGPWPAPAWSRRPAGATSCARETRCGPSRVAVAPGTGSPRGRRSRSSTRTTWTRAHSRRGRCSSSRASADGGSILDAPTSCGYGSAPPQHLVAPTHMRCPWCSADDDRVVDSRPAEGGVGHPASPGVQGLRAPLQHLRAGRGRRARGDQARRVQGAVRPGEGGRERPQGAQEPPRHPRAARRAWSIAWRSGCAARARRSPPSRSAWRSSPTSRKLDQVAYIRFASVYKDFQGISDFQEELTSLRKKEPAKRRPRG